MIRSRVVTVFSVVAAFLLTASAGAAVKVIRRSPRTAQVSEAEAKRAVTPGPIVSRTKWAGSRAIVRDVQSGAFRTPTEAEAAELVATLRSLTSKPARSIQPVVRADGSRQGSIDGAFATVVIARPAADGSMETRCIQTFEEAVEFLGLSANTN